jgi:ribonuclease T2
VAACAGAQARSRNRGTLRNQPGDFDFYLLSLSVAPSFCMLTRSRADKRECADPRDQDYRETPLTVHGLWPNRQGRSVNAQPSDCMRQPMGTLPADLDAELQRYMPGAADGLDRYEWEKHGGCSGLPPERYFRTIVEATRQANATIGAAMRERAMFGRRVGVGELLDSVATNDPALARAMVVDCRFRRVDPRAGAGSGREPPAYIEEIRIVLSKELARGITADRWPAALIPVESVGFRANSGCPNGQGYLPAGYNRR